MFCQNCGREIAEGQVCECSKNQTPVAKADNSKLFSILAYIPLLWLIGLFVAPECKNPKVRFHVGQGIIVTIVWAALSLAGSLVGWLIGLILRNFAGIITWPLGVAIFLVGVAGVAIGILNVLDGKQSEIPFVGKYSFIK